jgi:DNA repair protein RadD
VVAEYLKHGENRKFICSAVDTAHVEELQRQFLAAGINAATYTYKDKDEDRAETVNEFRKPTSTIRGLITVTAASKGFDVPDIGASSWRGRCARASPSTSSSSGAGCGSPTARPTASILDHSATAPASGTSGIRLLRRRRDELDDGKKKEKPKPKPKDEAEMAKCPACGHLHRGAPFCPACGHEYPKRQAVEHIPGTLKELVATGDTQLMRKMLWPQIVGYVQDTYATRGYEAAQRKAQAIYHELTGNFALGRVDNTAPAQPSHEVLNKIKANTIRWAKGRKAEPRA